MFKKMIMSIMIVVTALSTNLVSINPAIAQDNPVVVEAATVKLNSGRKFKIPAYNGRAYAKVNKNKPFFKKKDMTKKAYERYSRLDKYGRAGTAQACLRKKLMPRGKRKPIGMVKPSGWHTVKYDCVPGKYLYNRCHLIGWQLTAENANRRNLITGTRYMNMEGMLPFENMLADYVKETNKPVMYRVTPIFLKKELVARGCLLEAKSVRDNGDDIEFCVFVFNRQPGVKIDYKTGNSRGGTRPAPKPNPTPIPQPKPNPTPIPRPEPPTTEEQPETTPENVGGGYILNANSMIFHRPDCSYVKRMSQSNRISSNESRESLIRKGYRPCSRCHP